MSIERKFNLRMLLHVLTFHLDSDDIVGLHQELSHLGILRE